MRAPRRLIVNRRLLVAGLLSVAAAGLVLVLTRPAPSVEVLIAAADAPGGTRIAEMALETREVADAAGLVEADLRAEIEDWSISTALSEGEPLLHSVIRPRSRVRHPDAMGVTLDAAHAAQGSLLPGDVVDVYSTATSDPPVTRLLASWVLVLDVVPDTSGLGTDDDVRLLLAVDDNLAGLLIEAIQSAEVDVVRVGR